MKDNRHTRLPFDDPGNLKDYNVYNFKDSGDGKSWLLGTDKDRNASDYANAYRGGYSQCPVDITVPRSLRSKTGITRPVEVIVYKAYYRCACPTYGSNTKTVLVTKQVRIIKTYGFGDMYNVESFRIEEGSVLQSIYSLGLSYIGYNTGINDANNRKTLVLPSTLSSVTLNGIYDCNLFKVIIYCGTHSLTEKSQLYTAAEGTKVKVTKEYSANIILGQTPIKNSQDEVIEKCNEMALLPTPHRSNSMKNTSCSYTNKGLLALLLSCISLSNSNIPILYSHYSDSDSYQNSENETRRKRSSLRMETEVLVIIRNRAKDHRKDFLREHY